jgi:HPt (histidine-containing phosphotransfer) domain-containing protein
MTPRQVFEMVVTLETDLADFYLEIGQIERLKPFADIFSYMTDHSQNHARQIDKAAASIELPELNTDPIVTLHRRIKESLQDKVLQEEDTDKVMAELARAEEIIGTLYQSIAAHYRNRISAYSKIAEQFDQLSAEEFAHRDFINNHGGG